ncbi:MAG: iron-containing alcohol dehydrogenase, partial [Allosphingosinicella sp.]
MSFSFAYGPRLVAGPGRASELAGLLPPGPCLFVTDAGLRALGLADAALVSLEAAGIEARIFDAVEADPSRDTLLAAVAAGEGCASVVGFGGGSPMDVAKLAAYLLGSGDELEAIWGVGKATGPRLP